MKYSEITGERTADVIATIIPIIYNLSEDKQIAPLFRPNIPPAPKGVDPKKHIERYSKKITRDRVTKYIPLLLTKYKKDIYTVIATINNVPYEESVSELSMPKLIQDIFDLINDGGFAGLFPSAQSEDSSTSAPENTEDIQAQ